jgi:hypothetical protein
MHSSDASTNTVAVSSSGGCTCYVINTNSWITIVSGTNGTGNGTMTYTVSANASASALSGNIRIGDQVFLVTQSGNANPTCTYSILPSSRTHGSGSATNTVALTTQNGCTWSVVNTNASWITIISLTNTTGSGTVGYTLTANPSASTRSGNLVIGGKVFAVTQSGSTNAARLKFMSRTETNATLSVQGDAGKMYVVEASEDLIHWLPISTNSASSTVTDTAVGNVPHRFYRTVESP